jgi:hypothetical protein
LRPPSLAGRAGLAHPLIRRALPAGLRQTASARNTNPRPRSSKPL